MVVHSPSSAHAQPIAICAKWLSVKEICRRPAVSRVRQLADFRHFPNADSCVASCQQIGLWLDLPGYAERFPLPSDSERQIHTESVPALVLFRRLSEHRVLGRSFSGESGLAH